MARANDQDYLMKFRFKVRLGDTEIGCARVLFDVKEGFGYLSFERGLSVGKVEFLAIAQGVVAIPDVVTVIPMNTKNEEVVDRGVSLQRPRFYTYGVEWDAMKSEVLLEKLVIRSTMWEVAIDKEG